MHPSLPPCPHSQGRLQQTSRLAPPAVSSAHNNGDAFCTTRSQRSLGRVKAINQNAKFEIMDAVAKRREIKCTSARKYTGRVRCQVPATAHRRSALQRSMAQRTWLVLLVNFRTTWRSDSKSAATDWTKLPKLDHQVQWRLRNYDDVLLYSGAMETRQ